MMLIPTVIEQTGKGAFAYDIWSRLMKDRILFLGEEIDDHVANILIAQMLFLASEDNEKPIKLYINSPGGSVVAGLAIYDTMQHIKCPVSTMCMGSAASMAAILLAAGAKGQRHVLPNSRVMIHQPWGVAHGQASDVLIAAREIELCKKKLISILSEHSGQTKEQIEKDCDRDYHLSAEEAVKYGLVDKVNRRAVQPKE